MNISFVLAVYNKLELTTECYRRLRQLYPDAPLIISSGGSSDGTKEWLESLEDDNLSYFHDDTRLTFSETYNAGIDLVDTEKVVLIHNDMVIGKGFLESIERLLTENMILSYTTVEPPIFKGHTRPGKVLLDLGTGFDNFNDELFNQYVDQWKDGNNLYDGAVFFMSAYKKTFIDLNGFDGFSFVPCFCEDDDFLIRAKLKGYELKTCDSAITYHFVSQTSRFSDEMKDVRGAIEAHSIRNFIRKWGISIPMFNAMDYQTTNDFTYNKKVVGVKLDSTKHIELLEPFFDKIEIEEFPSEYVEREQEFTRYNLKSKFENVNDVDIKVFVTDNFNQDDFNMVNALRVSLDELGPGIYENGNLTVLIIDKNQNA
jgi:GT2 family glycosyltransferase